MTDIHRVSLHHYIIHGYGNSIGVQARLTGHGRSHHLEWDPGPPSWRLNYDTTLSQTEIERLLADLVQRYDLKVTELAPEHHHQLP
jgi:hypothetical protein